MINPLQSASSRPRAGLVLAALAAAVLTGAALAGWLDHGAEIFVSMASDAWAYCF
jgi:hypothetical protein